MKVGIMQPYFIPYIGYWQLMNAVDKYVIFDDVNYIKRGWINRNRILINKEPQFYNLPLLKVSQNKLINEIQVKRDSKLIEKNLRTVELSYKKAPYYQNVYPLIEKIMCSEKQIISEFIGESFQIICEYLDIKTEMIFSSQLEKNCSLKGQEKILSICEQLGATEYYNAIGGQELYDYGKFAEKRISLKFLKTDDIRYKQFGNEFYPNLSILDVMMFNSVERIKKMLGQYTLVENIKC